VRAFALGYVAVILASFAWFLRESGSVIVAILGSCPAWGIVLFAGLVERSDPTRGFAIFRWSVWNGTYREPPRLIRTRKRGGVWEKY
jgi:hypothetical protein